MCNAAELACTLSTDSRLQAALPTPAPDGVRVLVGNRKLMAEHSVVVPRDAAEYVRRQEGEGATCMLVAGGDR